MERDLERGEKGETSTGAEDNELFFDCEAFDIEGQQRNDQPQEQQQRDDHQQQRDEEQNRVGVQDPPQLPCLLPCLIGHNLRTISKIFTAFAGTVGLALLICFLGLTFTRPSSVISKPMDSSCVAPKYYGAILYKVVSVGLCITIIEYFASLIGAGNKEAEAAADPHVPVMRRVCVFVAAASQLGLTICTLWSLLLALMLRMGKFGCWNLVYSGILLSGFSIISIMSLYIVFIGLACVFVTN